MELSVLGHEPIEVSLPTTADKVRITILDCLREETEVDDEASLFSQHCLVVSAIDATSRGKFIPINNTAAIDTALGQIGTLYRPQWVVVEGTAEELNDDENDEHNTDIDTLELKREGSALDFIAAFSAEFETASDEGSNMSRTDSAVDAAPVPPPQTDILFIGAGPVGLWTAVNLKARNPHINITMLEKHATYQRKHVILLQPQALAGRPKGGKGHNSQEFCKVLDDFSKGLPFPAVRTNLLEDRLTNMAKFMGIHIIIQNVTNVVTDAVAVYKPKVVIGTDGSHSIVRDQFMKHGGGTPLAVQEVLDRTINLKFELQAPSDSVPGTKGIFNKSEVYELAKELPGAFAYFEHIGKPTTTGGSAAAKVPATLVLGGLSEEHFNTLKGATFRNPFTLTSNFEKMHPDIRGVVAGYITARTILKNDDRVPGSETIAPVSLNNYRSRLFGELVDVPEVSSTPIATFVVGDSSMGVPFFRALNAGLPAASQLAKLIDKEFLAGDGFNNWAKCATTYQRFMEGVTSREFQVARAKANGLRAARSWTGTFKTVPRSLQIMKFPDDVHRSIVDAVSSATSPNATDGEHSVQVGLAPCVHEWKKIKLLPTKVCRCAVCGGVIWVVQDKCMCDKCGALAHTACLKINKQNVLPPITK